MVQGISREKTKENKLECEALFKSVCEFESYIKDISIKMKRLLVEKKNYDRPSMNHLVLTWENQKQRWIWGRKKRCKVKEKMSKTQPR